MEQHGILAGIRIIEMSSTSAAAMASRFLAESGADVVKIEPPTGDPLRAKPGFIVMNRSKRSVVLDLTKPEDRKSFEGLLASADAFIHDLGPRAAKAQGFDDETLGRRFPQLIYCGISAFPRNHPDADRKALDALVLARGGFFDEHDPSNREGPIYLRAPFASIGVWYLAAIGIVARLMARERDGVGGAAHTSLYQGALTNITQHWARAETPTDSFYTYLVKDKRLGIPSYQCADGLYLHMMGVPDFVPLVREVMSEMGLTPPPIPATKPNVVVNRAPSVLDIPTRHAVFKRRTRAEWLAALQAHDIPSAPCLGLGEIHFDEQARVNGYVQRVDDPQFGPTLQPGQPFDTTPPCRIVSAAPRLGEHTALVLAENRPSLPARSGKSSGRPPLAGLKILDLGQYLAGPFGPMVLADLGAEVIKVEPPEGDAMRQQIARSVAGCQRGKRSIAIDVKNKQTRPIVEALVRWADVVHHNMRYDAALRLRVDYDSLKAIKPDLIYCHTSTYGRLGPQAHWPGYDPMAQAASGWEVEGAGEGNAPRWFRFGYMDHQCALASALATILAIWHKHKTGEAQFCSASLLGAAVQTTSETFVDSTNKVVPIEKLDHDQFGISPFNRIYQCADNWWIVVVAETEEEKRALLEALGVCSAEEIGGVIATLSQEIALYKLQRARVPAEPVRTNHCAAFFDSASNQAAGLVARYRSTEWGMLEQVGAFWTLGDLPLKLDMPPPAVGEHTRQILGELGIANDTVQKLLADGLIVAP